MPGGLAGPGRLRDPDGADPALTVVLDEQYHWVPRKALETGAALMRRMMPALPMSQLLTLVAELNKVSGATAGAQGGQRRKGGHVKTGRSKWDSLAEWPMEQGKGSRSLQEACRLRTRHVRVVCSAPTPAFCCQVWRDREKARLAEVAAAHAAEIKRLIATFKQRAPYEAVVAGEKLNDLKRRLKAQAAQAAALAAAAKGDQKRSEDDSKVRADGIGTTHLFRGLVPRFG